MAKDVAYDVGSDRIGGSRLRARQKLRKAETWDLWNDMAVICAW